LSCICHFLSSIGIVALRSLRAFKYPQPRIPTRNQVFFYSRDVRLLSRPEIETPASTFAEATVD
jgi:hypothetical protein